MSEHDETEMLPPDPPVGDIEGWRKYIEYVSEAADRAASRMLRMTQLINELSTPIEHLRGEAEMFRHDLISVDWREHHLAKVIACVERWYDNERKVNPDSEERESALEDLFHAVHEWTGDQLDG